MSDNLELWHLVERVRGPVSARVENLAMPEPNSGCWIWLGTVGRKGYGTITVSGRTQMAHRASYAAFNGPIPTGLHIDHKCRMRCCVNPTHLEAVTVAENNRRAQRPAITLATYCKHGHLLDGDNLQVGRQRNCRECRRRIALASYYRRRPNV